MIKIGLYTKNKTGESASSGGGFAGGGTTVIKDLYWAKDIYGTVWNDSPTKVDNDFTTKKIFLSPDAYIEFKDGAFHFSKGIYSDSFISAFGQSKDNETGGGVSNFKDLNDIQELDFNSNDNGKTIVWNGYSWVKGTSSSSGGVNYFRDLEDIKELSFNSSDSGKTVVWNGSTWVKGATNQPTNWNDIQNKPTFATVATTGNYNDLRNKPSILTEDDIVDIYVNNATSADKLKTKRKLWGNDFDGTQNIFGNLQFGSQISTAFIKYENGVFHFTKPIYSDGYISAFGNNDNQPEIINYFKDLKDIKDLNFNSSDNGKTVVWNGYSWVKGTAGGSSIIYWNDIQNKPTFATVATSGSYNDLTNKPTIPTESDIKNTKVNNASTADEAISLTTKTKSIWGQQYWKDGKPVDIGSATNYQNMDYVNFINGVLKLDKSTFNSETFVTLNTSGYNNIDFSGGQNNDYYAHKYYYFRPAYHDNGKTHADLYIQNASNSKTNPTFETSHQFLNNGDATHYGNVNISRNPSPIYTRTDAPKLLMNGRNVIEFDTSSNITHLNYASGNDTQKLRIYGNETSIIKGTNTICTFGQYPSDTRTGLSIQNGNYFRIGDALISYDTTNHALKIEDFNGNAMNLYTTGGVSALGMNGNSGNADIDNLTVKNTVSANTVSANTVTVKNGVTTNNITSEVAELEEVTATEINTNILCVNGNAVITDISTDTNNRLIITLQNGKKYQLNPIN